MPYSKKVKNAKCQSKKLPSHMIRYTNVWSFKSNDEAKFQRFSNTIKAVLDSKHLLSKLKATDIYDDYQFWKSVSKYLKAEYSISKKPGLLKKFFKNFYLKETSCEFFESQDELESLNVRCIATYKFDKNQMILLNSTGEKILPIPIQNKIVEKEKIPESSMHGDDTQEVLNKLPTEGTYYNESPDLEKLNASEYFKSSAYSLFSAETEHLVCVLENIKPTIDPSKFYSIDSYDQPYNKVPTLADVDYALPDWVFEPNSHRNQYTHFHRCVAFQSQLELFYRMTSMNSSGNSNGKS